MKIFGGILLAIGILIAGCSGLCSLVFGISMIAEADPSIFGLVLVVGGLPFLIGIGLVFAGRALLRKAREEEQQG